MVGVGGDQLAIVTQPIGVDAGLPCASGRGANPHRPRRRSRVGADQIERPVALATPTLDTATAVRYDGTVVFFLDERVFPEPSGFWVGGAREARLVLSPDQAGTTQAIVLRNAPVENTITLDTGGRREEIVLKPGEERRIEVPIDAKGGAALLRIRASTGFRPSQADPNSRDSRLLGVFVMVR